MSIVRELTFQLTHGSGSVASVPTWRLLMKPRIPAIEIRTIQTPV
jgi:hypothetical protein